MTTTLAIVVAICMGYLLLLNLLYLVLMIHDWAEQGQNSMMALIAIVVLGTHAWQTWSVGEAVGLF